MLRKLIISVLMIIMPIILLAQEISISDISLPFNASTVTGLTQDKIGNIWIATNDVGLYKYDGTSFKSFFHRNDDLNSLISDRLECLQASGDGRIWIGSFASGLSIYDPNTESFDNLQHDPDDPKSIRANDIRSFVEDANGGMWIGTLAGIDYWNPESKEFEHDFESSEAADILAKQHVRNLMIDQYGTIWAGTSSPFYGEQSAGGLFKIDPITKSVERYAHSSNNSESLADNIVTAVFEDSRGVFWIGTAGDGLHTMDRELGTFKRHAYDPVDPSKLSRPAVQDFGYARDHIRFIEEDVNGHIWIGTMNNGINVYNPNEQKVKHLTTEREDEYRLGSNDQWSVLKSRDNLLWIGAWSPGDTRSSLMKVNFNPNNLTFRTTNYANYSFIDGPTGILYVGSNGLVYEINDNNDLVRAYYVGRDEVRIVRSMIKDINNNLWCSTNLGLVFINTQDHSYKVYPLIDQELAIGEPLQVENSIFLNSDSLLLASANGVFIFDINSQEYSPVPFKPDYLIERSRNQTNLVYKDSFENIWIGFDVYGLHRLKKDLKTFEDFRFLTNVQDGPYVLKEDENQTVWAGNWRSGLKRYVPEQDSFVQVTDINGRLKAESGVTGISFVSDSVMWLTTNTGLISYHIHNQTSSLIDVDGLEQYDITSRGFFTSQNGYSYIGLNNGFLQYKESEYQKPESQTYQVELSKFLLGDTNITDQFSKSDHPISLDYNENDVGITMNYINFSSTSTDKSFEYKLEGHDEKWRIGVNDQEVLYYQLNPGKYQFLVKKLGDAPETSVAKAIFSIRPPWYRSWWAYIAYVLGGGVLIWWYNKNQRAITIRREREKNRDKELAQAKEIEKAYEQLKSTQAQLIHSEKMASLGELTAGIAHEIQNPLNFVNNFSEVSSELIDEAITELKTDPQEAEEILADLKQNMEKITHHGRRAESIVKGMLQHSRNSEGEKIATDINALCDEYLRLAFHGLRAKDRTFNAEFKTDFDYELPKIEIVPQDISRVVLNILTNAFYTVDHKAKLSDTPEGYEPMVTVKTYSTDNIAHISITDNGQGMTEETKNKIFQPFYTTKPTGEGTGLGLSMSYEIVKAHGGSIEVESELGKGTSFIIRLVS